MRLRFLLPLRRIHLAMAVALSAAAPLPAEEPAKSAATPAKVFVSVANTAGAALKGREQALENLVASRIAASSGLAVLSRADAVKNLADTGETGAIDPANVAAALDEKTSALRLAQNLGATGILSVSIVSLTKESLVFRGSGVETVNDRHTLRVSWKLLEAGSASGVIGDTVTARRTVRNTPGLTEIPGDPVDGLLDDAAQKVAADITLKTAATPAVASTLAAASAARVKFGVTVGARNIFFPELTVDKAGVLHLSQDSSPVTLDAVTVELDGVAVGTAPFAAQVGATPGLHRMRLTREGFKSWEGMVNLYDGFVFNAALELDAAGLKRWREQSSFIRDLKNGEKLTDAMIAKIRAEADNLKNYGFKVDVKVDADELPDNNGSTVQVIPGAGVVR